MPAPHVMQGQANQAPGDWNGLTIQSFSQAAKRKQVLLGVFWAFVAMQGTGLASAFT